MFPSGLFSPSKKKRSSQVPVQPTPVVLHFGPPEILPQDITYDPVHDLIGDGQYGSVFKGRCRGLEVAVKIPHKQNFSNAQLASFRHEVEMLSKISHPNVVRFMGACTEEGKLQIVTERCRANLEALLASSVPLSFYERLRMAHDAALGMTWLHEIHMVHRDLKTANLLVDFNNRVKVADFGFSQIKEADSLVEPKGTLVWMAPEMIMGARYTEKVDVYSFGIILWEIITREKPYPHYTDPQEFCHAICYQLERPVIPANTPEPLKQLITLCWHQNSSERCSFNHIAQCLNEIMVDCVIENPAAAQFWKKYFMNNNHEEKVEWEIFEECLCKEINFEIYDGCTFLSYLMTLLLIDDSGKPTEFVTMVKFDKVVKWFGNFFDPKIGTQIIQGISELLQKSWFHGDINSIEAAARLQKQPEGTFLIRFSSSDPKVSPFTLSTKAGHARIERLGEGFKVQGKVYKSLSDYVESNGAKLKRACPKTYEENYEAVGEDSSPKITPVP